MQSAHDFPQTRTRATRTDYPITENMYRPNVLRGCNDVTISYVTAKTPTVNKNNILNYLTDNEIQRSCEILFNVKVVSYLYKCALL